MALEIRFALPAQTPKMFGPFSQQQIDLLTRWQAAEAVEHIRCPRHGEVRRRSTELVAGPDGWKCHFRTPDYPDLVCSYTVNWAYAEMLDEEAVQRYESLSIQVIPVSFDDEETEPLWVFSDCDLDLATYDDVDLDWEEVAERSALDERRGLVITQSTVIEDLACEVILWLEAPDDPEARQRELDEWMIGRRLKRLEWLLARAELPEEVASSPPLEGLWAVVRRRNQLAHGELVRVVHEAVPREDGRGKTKAVEWQLRDRRSRSSERITAVGLRENLRDAAGICTIFRRWADDVIGRSPL